MATLLQSLTDAAQTVSGTKTFSGPLIMPKVTLTLANGANTDLAIPAGGNIFYVSGPSGAFNITGFAGGVDGRIIEIINLVAQNMTFTHQATSAAGNQITTLTGSDVATTAAGYGKLYYDGTTSKWILLSSTA